MTSASNHEGYESILSRGGKESDRLNIQHKAWMKLMGYHIHPKIEARLPSSPRIADVATGTGIWALEMASLNPNASISAFDISGVQFPDPATTPSNVTFHIADAKQAFPTDLHGTFDLVHVSFLTAAMKKEDWSAVVDNVSSLLKQGGALQWKEPEVETWTAYRGDVNAPFECIPRITKLFRAHLKANAAFIAEQVLQDLFIENGMEGVFVDKVDSGRLPETRKAFSESNLAACILWCYKMAEMGKWSQSEVEGWEKEFQREIDGGAYSRYELLVTIGFKA